MQKILYFLVCFIVSFAFFIPTVNALSDTGFSQGIAGSAPPATIFHGPPTTILKEPPTTIFHGAPVSIFNRNSGSLNQVIEDEEIEVSEQSNSNTSGSQGSSMGMQKTGLPLSMIFLAILFVFGGFIGFKRRL